MKTVRFVMALHNHQPVGNFDDVFDRACRVSYHPFLDTIEPFPWMKFVLHYSGPLWEWAEAHDRRLIQRVVEGARAGRFELLAGGLGEPILTMLPTADAVDQIRLVRRHLKKKYEVPTRGIWMTERIWEAPLAGVLAAAGVQYTVLDDFHFKAVGLRDRDLTGYFITEDQGRLLRVFSGSEFLRYSIPFRDPKDTIDYLRSLASEDGRNVVVYADDGEKFGMWPETYKHVFENKWLERFLRALEENRDWINVTTFSDVVDSVPAAGKIYLADASYREMTEWSLPVPAQKELQPILHDLERCGLAERARPFLRGGTWRNFKVKFREAAQMYARMIEASRAVADRSAAKMAEEAREELFRGQCNCAYWHGVFGGLYMPFLRFAVYEKLLKAEKLIAPANERPGHTMADFDLDGRPEIKLRGTKLNCYFKPDRGAALYELDDRERCWNLTAVMTRREEVYHQRLVEGVRKGVIIIQRPDQPLAEKAVSIHDQVRCKEPGLEQRLWVDRRLRESLVDHFLPADATPDRLRREEVPEWGDFASGEYEADLPRSRVGAVTFRREGRVGPEGRRLPLLLSKRVRLEDSTLEVRYAMSFPQGAPAGVLFAPEFNFGLMAGAAFDRNYFSAARENLGNLSALISRPGEPALGLVDEYLGVELWLSADPAAGFWAYPVETVNDSEGGFERVYQSSAVLPWWELKALPGEEQVVTLTLEVRHR